MCVVVVLSLRSWRGSLCVVCGPVVALFVGLFASCLWGSLFVVCGSVVALFVGPVVALFVGPVCALFVVLSLRVSPFCYPY